MMVATRASQVEEVEAEDTILAGKQPNMMMMICVLPETDVHFAFRCRLVPVHCMPNVTKTVSRTSLLDNSSHAVTVVWYIFNQEVPL